MAKREGASNWYHKRCGRCGGSGGVLFLIIQVVVEGDNSADKFPQLHKISRDDVYSTFTRSLCTDPLHHARKSPEKTHIYRPIQSNGICSQTEHKIAQFQNIVSCLLRQHPDWNVTYKRSNLECKLQHYMSYK